MQSITRDLGKQSKRKSDGKEKLVFRQRRTIRQGCDTSPTN